MLILVLHLNTTLHFLNYKYLLEREEKTIDWSYENYIYCQDMYISNKLYTSNWNDAHKKGNQNKIGMVTITGDWTPWTTYGNCSNGYWINLDHRK
jgi:hypothetical protein